MHVGHRRDHAMGERIPMYQVDAFSNRVFSGNPAAVCPVDRWLDDSILQAIAAENNLSETAFFVPEEGGYRIRWFTPVAEVDLCGHATLASAFVVFSRIDKSLDRVLFRSKSGDLTVTRKDDMLAMNFPSQPPVPCERPEALVEGLGREPLEVLCSEDYLALFSSQKEVLELDPDMRRLMDLNWRGVIVTARGDEVDFVSRFFAPKFGIDEDPVTGSAHCALTPFWAEKLDKKELHARQISRRGGELFCKDRGDRVEIAGKAVLFMEGHIII
jgi:PhzF family phenazine biosynthesis protein